MKPITIEFTCFGPYMERQFVDFTELEQSGLFLICGETGAGKTTILDAMCVALYGKASGAARGELADMRCKLAGRDDVTRVEFVFDNGGRRYKFLRSLRRIRTRNQEEVKYDEEQQCMELLGGEWKPFLANAKKSEANARAEDIIGLTYDQFRQVIILPQGQFERLLTSKSDEKEEILTKLFHAERWGQAVQAMYERVSARDAALRERSNQITARLEEYGCTGLDELAQKETEGAVQLQELKQQAEAAGAAVGEQRKRQEQALLDSQEFGELARREKALSALQARTAAVEEREKLLALAGEAEKLRPVHEAYVYAKTALQAAQTAAASAGEKMDDAAAQAEAARKARQAHEAGREGYDESKSRLVLLENARTLYAMLAEKRRQRDEVLALHQKKVDANDKAERAFEKADTAWQQAMEQQKTARSAYQNGQTAYLQGIGGILAQKLVQGEPCPVCGSREHPAPAAVQEGHITDSELDALARAESQANEAEVNARKARGEAEQVKNLAAKALTEAFSELSAANAACESAEAGKLEGVDTPDELEKEIAAVSDAIAAFERAESDTAAALQAAQTTEKLAKAEAERLQKELEKAQSDESGKAAAWHSALEASSLADEAQFTAACIEPEERQNWQRECTEFRTELKSAAAAAEEKRAALEGRTAPDMGAVAAAVKEAEAKEKSLNSQIAVEEEKLAAMHRTMEDLTGRKQTLDAERVAVDRDMEFARRLRGSAGVGLQRYVLGVRFAAVTAEANRLLETVYGGRYRLYRTDEASGRTHKKGLELEVYDNDQNQRRSVNTLSGGEKFLVSLSLAIGLSAVVRAGGGGVHMEAMFVDEGFGSLDDNAVDDAVSILQSIRQSSGAVVGVISHVGRLEETIPAKLEVKKGKDGSHIYMRS